MTATVNERLFHLEVYADRIDPVDILWKDFFKDDGKFTIELEVVPEILSQVGEKMVLKHQFSQTLDPKSPLLEGRRLFLQAIQRVADLQREKAPSKRKELCEIIKEHLQNARIYFQKGGREYPCGVLCTLLLEILIPKSTTTKEAPQ